MKYTLSYTKPIQSLNKSLNYDTSTDTNLGSSPEEVIYSSKAGFAKSHPFNASKPVFTNLKPLPKGKVKKCKHIAFLFSETDSNVSRGTVNTSSEESSPSKKLPEDPTEAIIEEYGDSILRNLQKQETDN